MNKEPLPLPFLFNQFYKRMAILILILSDFLFFLDDLEETLQIVVSESGAEKKESIFMMH